MPEKDCEQNSVQGELWALKTFACQTAMFTSLEATWKQDTWLDRRNQLCIGIVRH